MGRGRYNLGGALSGLGQGLAALPALILAERERQDRIRERQEATAADKRREELTIQLSEKDFNRGEAQRALARAEQLADQRRARLLHERDLARAGYQNEVNVMGRQGISNMPSFEEDLQARRSGPVLSSSSTYVPTPISGIGEEGMLPEANALYSMQRVDSAPAAPFVTPRQRRAQELRGMPMSDRWQTTESGLAIAPDPQYIAAQQRARETADYRADQDAIRLGARADAELARIRNEAARYAAQEAQRMNFRPEGLRYGSFSRAWASRLQQLYNGLSPAMRQVITQEQIDSLKQTPPAEEESVRVPDPFQPSGQGPADWSAIGEALRNFGFTPNPNP